MYIDEHSHNGSIVLEPTLQVVRPATGLPRVVVVVPTDRLRPTCAKVVNVQHLRVIPKLDRTDVFSGHDGDHGSMDRQGWAGRLESERLVILGGQ